MPMYNVRNSGRSARMLYGERSRVEHFNAGEERELHLPDGTAIMIRRCEMRGDTLHITHKDDEGAAILEIAHKYKPRINRSMFPHPSTAQPPQPFIDELVAPPQAPTGQASLQSQPIADAQPMRRTTTRRRRVA